MSRFQSFIHEEDIMIVISKRSVTSFAVATLTTLTTNPCFAATGLDKVDAAGNNILTIVRRIGYWVILIAAIYNVIGCVKEQDAKKLGHAVLFYILLYAVLFALPWFLRQVEGIF
jgi:uncharacterized membrane protein